MTDPNESWVTPQGVAIYPRLNEPDTKFDPNGVFSVTLRLPAKEGAALLKRLETRLDAFHAEQVKALRKPSLRMAPLPHSMAINDDGAETGEHDFKFKLKHNVTTRTGKTWTQRPKLFDGELRGFTGPVVGAQSKLVINFVPVTYHAPAMGCGITLRIKAVQVNKLVEYEPKETDYGFKVQKGGYVAPEELQPQFAEEKAPATSIDEL